MPPLSSRLCNLNNRCNNQAQLPTQVKVFKSNFSDYSSFNSYNNYSSNSSNNNINNNNS